MAPPSRSKNVAIETGRSDRFSVNESGEAGSARLVGCPDDDGNMENCGPSGIRPVAVPDF
jgi:hypothetical protein